MNILTPAGFCPRRTTGLPKFEKTLSFLAKKLAGRQYAIRGTAGLVLQGFDFNVDDIDILSNRQTAVDCNRLLKNYLKDEVDFKESAKFKSYFGRFEINDVLVEVMGEWQIKDAKGRWSKIFDASAAEINEIRFKGRKLRVTKPETELQMFALTGRWNALHKLKKEIDKTRQPSLF